MLNLFHWITGHHECEEYKRQLNELRDELVSTECALAELRYEREHLRGQVAESFECIQRERSENKYRWLYFLPSSQGKLFKRLLERHHDERNLMKFENICCPGMYLADRHSTIYELVNTIFIKDLTITNSHFESACFDTVTIRNVIFDKVSFYKAFFDDVLFEKCTFKCCDFNEAKGVNLLFKDCCIEGDTDLSKVKILEVADEDQDLEPCRKDEDDYF